MRTRTGLALVTFLGLGLSAATASAQLKGSDTLEEVTKDAIAAIPISGFTYLGGGSGAGESAMQAGTQAIAPMSRQLNSGASDAAKCTATAKQLAIALDGVAVVTGNPAHGDSLNQTATTTDDCSDSIEGKTLTGILKADGVTPCDASDGCSTPGQYTFADWKDVLSMVYGGMNNVSAQAKLFTAGGAACTYSVTQTTTASNETAGDSACGAGQVCFPNNKCGALGNVGYRNPARINCDSPVRRALAASYGNLFSDVGTTFACRTGTCTSLRHAYRRDDLSGTTDTFTSLVGLPSIPNLTKAFANNSPMPDRSATANAFCNAGPLPMNKGDADYLDNDPIRRAVDHNLVSGARVGLEQVSEFDSPSFGGNNNDANCNKGAIPTEHGSPTEPGVWPNPNLNQHDPATTSNATAMLAEMGSNGAGGVARGNKTRTCLGLVLPVSIPANFNNKQAYFGADPTTSAAPVVCDQLDQDGVSSAVASVIMDTLHSSDALCPNGTPQPCTLPFKFDPTLASTHNFNCLSDLVVPAVVGGYADRRIFNVHVVDSAGHYVKDNFINPNIPLSAARQNRVVAGFYRIHTTTNTNKNGSNPQVANCRTMSSTEQIGCLVKANTCSIGFAGREAADDILTLGSASNFAIMLKGFRPTVSNIQNLVNGNAANSYPASRVLWLNSINGFTGMSAQETQLFNFENTPASIDPIVVNRNFVQYPATDAGGNPLNRMKVCPATFP